MARLVAHAPDLWSAEYTLAWQFGSVPIPVRMTVIRLRDGALAVHSPAPLDAELRAELDALGRVAYLVVPAAHGKFAKGAAAAYPGAQVLEAEHAPDAWAGEVETHLVAGFRLREVVLLHRPSRTLVITDLAFNIHRSEHRFARVFFRANGMWQHFGPSRLIRRLAVSSRKEMRRSLEEILKWDFERILPGHGEVVEHGGPAALRAAWPETLRA